MRIKITKDHNQYKKESVHNLSVFKAAGLIRKGVARKVYK